MDTIAKQFQAGMEHHRAGRLQEAERLYRAILFEYPNHSDALAQLGVLAGQVGQFDAAAELLERAISISPRVGHYHINLGVVRIQQRRSADAVIALRRAVELEPSNGFALSMLASALKNLKQYEEAIAICRTLMQMHPKAPEPWYNLAIAQAETRQMTDAIESLRRAIELQPNHLEALDALGIMLCGRGRVDEAIECARRAIAAPGADSSNVGAVAHGNLLFALNYQPASDQGLLDAHVEWAKRHATLPKMPADTQRDCNPDRRLRVGYVSADMREHAVTYFLEPLLSSHDREHFEIFCYGNTDRPDSVTARLQTFAQWRDILLLSDDQAAALIRQDQIDILIDLSGHTAGNRLLIFARRPAPVQATYLGYPNTTGLATMDYRITDAVADPPGMTDAHHVEKLLRLPGCFLCYGPSSVAPAPRASRETDAQRGIVFGSFNNLAKLTQPMIKLWATILQTVPDSRLMLKADAFDDADGSARIRAAFNRAGIGEDRLDLHGRKASFADHLAAYHQMDIALDTFPYNGTTTTCEALYMGVPVITLAGHAHLSRVGASLLKSIAADELVAFSPEQYLQIAKELAADRPRLATLSRDLRQRMLASPLCDRQSFARGFETALRRMWTDHCASHR